MTLALDNGTVRVALVSHAAAAAGTLDQPTTGILWEDLERFFQEERLRALGVLTSTAPSSAGVVPPPEGGERERVSTATPEPTAQTAGEQSVGASGGGRGQTVIAPPPIPEGMASLALPCAGGAILVLLVIGILILRRRRG